MNKKISILLFFLFVLISMSAVSAVDADGNNDTIVSSADPEALAIENDVNAIDDLSENVADGVDEAIADDFASVAVGKNNEILQKPNSDDVLGAKGSKITIDDAYYQKIGSDYKIIVTGYVSDVDDEDINKGTVSIYLNDELKGYCDAEFGEFSGEVDVGPGSYNVRVRYHDDSGDYLDSQNDYYDNPIIIKAPEPVTWYVNGSKPYGNDGKSEADAFSTLNEALYAASNNDTVKIAAGTYAGSANTGVYIQKILTFEKYGGGEAIFDGQGQGTIWSVGVDTINIYGLTFINGGGTKGGALYFIRDLSNSVINATFRDNSVTMYGGAIYVDNSVSNLTLRSTFINNTANEYGAAVYIKSTASNLILNSTFIGNTAKNLGGAFCFNGDLTGVDISGKFINNTGGDSIIYIGNSVSGNSIHDSVFLNNEAYKIFSVNGGEITAKDNWFGSDASNYYKIPEDVGIDLENWLFLNATADPSELAADESSAIIFKLSSFDGSEIIDYDASKMNIVLDLSQTLGQLDKTSAPIGENITYTAKESGNATVTGKFETASYTISLKNNDAGLVDASVSVNNATLNLFVDDTFTIIANTTPAGLNVTFVQDDSGVYTVDNDGVVTALKEGTGNITVKVTGNEGYAENSTTVTVTVNEKPLPPKENLTISASAEPITVGENATVVVTGFENATGDVTAKAGNGVYTVPIVDGIATFTIPGLIENTTAVVTYDGDDNYNNASTTVDIVVNPRPKKDLTLNATVFEIMGNVTIMVSGFENATGNVTVTIGEYINTTSIMMGMALMFIPKYNETVTAYIYYPGDDNYNNASTTVDIIAKKNLNLTASADPIYVGQNATLIVTGFENATGNVMVITGRGFYNVNIIDSTVTVSISGLNNTTAAYVIYLGDDNYSMAFTGVNITVYPKENATIIIDAPSEVTEGDNVTVTVILPEDATGTVTIGNEAVPIVNGTASAVLTNLPLGNNTIPVTYSGDDKYNPIETNFTITASNGPDIISAPDVTKYYHGSERFVVNVTDYKGTPLANKSVAICINGVTYNRTTNANGTCSLALNLPATVYNVTTTVDNITIDSVVTILTTVNGTDVVKVFRNDTQYYATFRDSLGNYLVPGSQVEFNINGVFYYRYVSGDEGLAKLNLNLEQGTYILTARNLQTDEMSSNNITITPKIIENNDLVKYYRNASQYTVKVIGDDGNVAGAGVNVTFNINGVLYTRQTNASGIAKLNINLQPGDYIITADCNGFKVANNIKVLPVLTASDLTKKYGTPDQFVATLVDGQGNPYDGQTVRFNVHGVLYDRVTDNAGQAKLNIRLMPGEYIITSSYNGSNIANKITVSS